MIHLEIEKFGVTEVTAASCWDDNCGIDRLYSPFLMLDGKPNTFYASKQLSSRQGPLWIQLELHNLEIVSEVRITNRNEDCCADSLSQVEFRVAMDKITDSDSNQEQIAKLKKGNLCRKLHGKIDKGITYVALCNQPFPGRYVTIEIQDQSVYVINIAEVEVYGRRTSQGILHIESLNKLNALY